MARLVRSYVEHVWPHLERGGGTPDTPMQAFKGSSNPPVSPWVLRLIKSNETASGYLHWVLGELERGSVRSSEGIYYSEVLGTLRYDPGALQTWRDKDPKMLHAFGEMAIHAARGVLFIYGPRQIGQAMDEPEMKLDENGEYAPNPEAFVIKRHPDDEEESRGRTRKGQRIDTMHTRRLMVEQLEQLEASTDYTGLAAMEILSERKAKEGKDWSVRKIRRAVECVNREREGAA